MNELYHYNHNHDRLGRFARSPGGGSRGEVKAARKQNFKEHEETCKAIRNYYMSQAKGKSFNERSDLLAKMNGAFISADTKYHFKRKHPDFKPETMSAERLTNYLAINARDLNKSYSKSCTYRRTIMGPGMVVFFQPADGKKTVYASTEDGIRFTNFASTELQPKYKRRLRNMKLI